MKTAHPLQGKISPSVFDRSQVAQLLQMQYGLVKNWSTGKPLSITPSVRAPGKKGALSLFSLNDVYRMGIARNLVLHSGWNTGKIEDLLKQIKDDWLDASTRGLVLVYDWESGKPMSVRHLPGVSYRDAKDTVLEELKKGGRPWSASVDLKTTLELIDEAIQAQ